MKKHNPKFVALLPVRDEADIIYECLNHALAWADQIFVFDTGSIDSTYEIVQEMSLKDCRIVPIGSDPVYYNENRVRGYLFNEARQHMSDGDWFLRIDADEFHHVTPQKFVDEKLNPLESVVYHQYFDFQLTDAEVETLGTAQAIEAERQRPIAERRTKYTISVYAEPRLCRYRRSMRWPVEVSFPYNAGLIAKNRIPIRHYPHRDPAQLARRCQLREIMMADEANRQNWTRPDAHHWSVSDWSRFIVKHDDPALGTWVPGESLPEVKQLNHVKQQGIRLAQESFHRFGVPRLLDMFRNSWNDDAYPMPIERETQLLLSEKLG